MRLRPVFLAVMVVLLAFNFSFVSLDSSPEPIPLDPVTFANVTWDAGLKGVGGQFLAWGDYNNDGFLDLLVNGARLFENSGPPNWDFSEVSGQVGISGGSYGTWADWNNDGYLDFYTAGSDKLYSNNGPPDWDFTDVTAASGISQESHSTGVGWGDYDNDGYVDLFKIRGEDWDNSLYFPNSFWRNEGDGTFTNVTVEAGVDESSDPKYSRGVAWADYNYDGWLDIYISNYRQLDNYLYENQGDGTFIDVAPQKGVADGPPFGEGGNTDPYDRPGHGVGSVWGDYDNDGYFDLWVTNLNHKDARTSDDSLLYHSDGPPDYTFTSVRDQSGIHIKPYVVPNEGDELFVGCAWGDYDNDGDIDLYLPQIYDIDYAYSFLYSNNGDGTFTDVTVEADVRVWDTYAGCWADYDNDGDLDLITSGRDGGGEDPVRPHFVHLYRNDGTSGNWLKLNLKGNGHNTNKAAIGAWVEVTTDSGDVQIAQVEGGMGPHGMQNSLEIDLGFGDYTGKVDIKITWTGKVVQKLYDVDLNQLLTVTEPAADVFIMPPGVSNENPVQGSTIDVTTYVVNMGDVSIRSAVSTFYLGPPENNVIIGGPYDVPYLHHGDSLFMHATWDTTGFSGLNSIYAVVEATDPYEEELSNNQGITDVFVREQNELPVPRLDVAALKVRDDDGAESQEADEVSLRVEGPPFAVLSASPTSTSIGETVTFDASESTDDNLNLEFLFDFGDGEDSGWITSATTTHEYSLGGLFTASVVVRDSGNLESENAAVVDIQVTKPPNLAPIAFIDAITPTSATLGITVYFEGHGQDDDGTITDYEWRSDLDGELSSAPVFSTSELSVGEHAITFRVKDNLGDWSDEAIQYLTIKLENILPTLEIISPADFEDVSGKIVISGVAEDDDGDIVRVEVRVDEGAWEEAQGTSAWSFSLNTSNLADGEHTISVRAFDGEEYSEVTAISIIVRQEGKSDGEGELSTIFIIAIVIGIIGVVLVLAAALGRYIKKENAQVPPKTVEVFQPAEPPQEPPPARMNW
jgi:hypothetical protein